VRDDQLTKLLELYAAELQDRFHAVPRQFEDRPGMAGYARLVAQLDHVLWMIAQMQKGMQPAVNAWDGQKLNRCPATIRIPGVLPQLMMLPNW
jgi:hypothetical protein